MKNFYTTQQVAEMLEVNIKTIRGLIESGKISAINVSSGSLRPRYRISADEVKKFKSA